MPDWVFAVAGIVLVGLFIWLQRRWQRHQIVVSRIPQAEGAPVVEVLEVGQVETLWERLLPWILGGVGFFVFVAFTSLGPFFALSVAALAFVLGHLVKGILVSRRVLALEVELAEAIDHIVTSLHAGVGVLDALMSAEQAARKTLKPYLTTLVSRIQLGDDPPEVCKDLSRALPLESFRLFYFALAVQWEGGGNLAPTLATTGRFIRDRVEVGRLVRAHTTEARVSVIAILGLTYVLALLMWHTGHDRMEGFLGTNIGRWAVGVTIVLQAIGAAWIGRMSRIRF